MSIKTKCVQYILVWSHFQLDILMPPTDWIAFSFYIFRFFSTVTFSFFSCHAQHIHTNIPLHTRSVSSFAAIWRWLIFDIYTPILSSVFYQNSLNIDLSDPLEEHECQAYESNSYRMAMIKVHNNISSIFVCGI